ncbi:MAG: topoisomerase DNA-binding C4 zinc finger domain-containing protein [Anaerolineales bacterium]|nr:topoisomerase DNA-binding C4 zinc finger domain-containing protein [Anaerolineales bacterium]
MTPEHEALLEWARTIYWGGAPPAPLANADLNLSQLKTTLPPWSARTALAALRNWLNEPPQSGVRDQLREGLTQIGWDTPSAAGRRLISDLLWNTVMARFGVIPDLALAKWVYQEVAVEFGMQVVDAPHGRDEWERTGWVVRIHLECLNSHNYHKPLEWVLNALLFYDVELGLADQPLYLRRHQRPLFGFALSGGEQTPREPPDCPDCGAAMVPKHRNRNGSPFWGCPNYPGCHGSRSWKARR